MHIFHIIAKACANAIGNAWAFIAAVLLVIVWLILGPIFDFSDTWQLVINTLTTIITFIVVFLIQNSQNRDTESIHIKLDELLRVHKLAHKSIIDLDELTDEQIKELEKKYKQLSPKIKGDEPNKKNDEK